MPLTPADVHNVAFKKPPIGKRGYDEDEVDAFLDLIEAELARLIEENNDLKQQVDDMARSGPPQPHGGQQQLRQQPPAPEPMPMAPPPGPPQSPASTRTARSSRCWRWPRRPPRSTSRTPSPRPTG